MRTISHHATNDEALIQEKLLIELLAREPWRATLIWHKLDPFIQGAFADLVNIHHNRKKIA